WHGGGVLRIEVDDVDLRAAVAGHDYDTVEVKGLLTAVPNGGKLVVALDSLSKSLLFDPNANYSLKVLEYDNAAGLDLNDIELDATDFDCGSGWEVAIA